MDIEKIISRMVQVGYVTAIDSAKRKVRVRFPDTRITSDWIYVLQHSSADICIKPDGSHTHSISDSYTGGGSAGTVENHNHKGSYLTTWMPKIKEQVVVLYLPVADGDGFVLEGI